MNVASRRLSAGDAGLGTNFLGYSNITQPLNEKRPLIKSESGLFSINGRGEKIRTSDPHNPIVVRYQAALRPDRTCFVGGPSGPNEFAAKAAPTGAAIITAGRELGKKRI